MKLECVCREKQVYKYICLKTQTSFFMDDASLLDDIANDLLVASQLIYEVLPAVSVCRERQEYIIRHQTGIIRHQMTS